MAKHMGGIFRRKGFVWDGPLAFRRKDAIDRRFMRKFLGSGERQESPPDG